MNGFVSSQRSARYRPTFADGLATAPRPTYLWVAVPDLYGVLGVAKDASQQDIKKAYRQLAQKYHPDKSPGEANEQRFKDVAGAYEVLGDEKRRKLYDEFGELSLRPGFDEQQARAARSFGGFSGGGGNVQFDLGDLFGGGGGGGGGFGDMLGDMFRRRGAAPGAGPGFPGQPPSRARRGHDVSTTVKIGFSDAVRGTTVKLAPRGGDPITVRIPPGADDGTKVRVRGKGGDGQHGAPSGDLFLLIEVEPHEHFTREGDDLYLELPITLSEAYHGSRVTVPTPTGEVKLTVPKGVQSGQKMRLRGKGVQLKDNPGDLYVTFMVTYPVAEDDAVIEAIASLSKHESDPRDGLSF